MVWILHARAVAEAVVVVQQHQQQTQAVPRGGIERVGQGGRVNRNPAVVGHEPAEHRDARGLEPLAVRFKLRQTRRIGQAQPVRAEVPAVR
ncbi:MAG: hypothetical protein FJW30_15915 [Acidobacteria bacterium]|nr:hypothetical protein [Acidobacteriota bacterium]